MSTAAIIISVISLFISSGVLGHRLGIYLVAKNRRARNLDPEEVPPIGDTR